MKFIEFNDVIFETTGLIIRKSNSYSQTDLEATHFELIVANGTMATEIKYETEEDRDETYKRIKEIIKIYVDPVECIFEEEYQS